MTALSYGKATPGDIPLIVALVNAAYRGEISKMGWTTEAHILGGQRTDEDEITRLMADVDSFILLCYLNGEAVGTAHLKKVNGGAYLGMLTIKPGLQGQGMGKAFLAAAERGAQEAWGAKKITMSVITLRHELIAYYERRGYRRTGVFDDFPQDPRFGLPKVENLQFEYLEKYLNGVKEKSSR
jgi:ribosomal protein S18 acetylase RimI-like enzyme